MKEMRGAANLISLIGLIGLMGLIGRSRKTWGGTILLRCGEPVIPCRVFVRSGILWLFRPGCLVKICKKA